MDVKQRHFIKSSEIKDLKKDISAQYSPEVVEEIIPKKSKVEVILTEAGDELYAVNDKLVLWKSKKEGYIPVLTILLNNRIGLKTVVVDMGAVKFVANGADIMRPGIKKIDSDIKKGDIIRISDEKHDRSLAIGKAMYDAAEMDNKSGGKVIKNLHTVNDSVWQFEKDFK